VNVSWVGSGAAVAGPIHKTAAARKKLVFRRLDRHFMIKIL
jgi:hypothetical protein